MGIGSSRNVCTDNRKETRQVKEEGWPPGIGRKRKEFYHITSHHSLCLLCLGEHLRICPQEYTCCSSEIEERLTWDTEATFRGLVEESGSFLVHTLASRHRTFDGEGLGSPILATQLLAVLMIPASILSSLPTLSLRHPCPVLVPTTPPQALSRVLPHPILDLPKSESCSVSNSLVFSLPTSFLPLLFHFFILLWPLPTSLHFLCICHRGFSGDALIS